METAVAIAEPKQIAHRSIFEMEPEDQIRRAAEIATVLVKVIDKQKLYTNIQGKNYVRVEGWQILGRFLGITTKERNVTRMPDGSYEAYVDLVNANTGAVVGGGSALCSVNEKRWGGADEYARRSMAITRAVGKAYRINFSDIISLAGYEVTPEEEIPQDGKVQQKAGDLEAPTGPGRLNGILLERGVDPKYWDTIAVKMKGKKPVDLTKVINEVVG